MTHFDAAFVKRRAKELGADLVGIASAATLNAFPPDPRWPQTPERISPYCKSVIDAVQRLEGEFELRNIEQRAHRAGYVEGMSAAQLTNNSQH